MSDKTDTPQEWLTISDFKQMQIGPSYSEMLNVNAALVLKHGTPAEFADRIREEGRDRVGAYADILAELREANRIIADLQRQLAEARKDGERLDWLFTGDGSMWIEVDNDLQNARTREEIDQAMKEAK